MFPLSRPPLSRRTFSLALRVVPSSLVLASVGPSCSPNRFLSAEVTSDGETTQGLDESTFVDSGSSPSDDADASTTSSLSRESSTVETSLSMDSSVRSSQDASTGSSSSATSLTDSSDGSTSFATDAGVDASEPVPTDADGSVEEPVSSEPDASASDASISTATSTSGRTTENETSAPPWVCTTTLTLWGIIRDFSEDHPDMEPCEDPGVECSGEHGLVETWLGSDDKPVFTSEPRRASTTVKNAASFAQWFNDVPDVNVRSEFPLELTLDEGAEAVATYDSAQPPEGSPPGFLLEPKGFFPIDESNTSAHPHNYHFTYEVLANIEYSGGETLTVRGDDDIFVFINRQLVIDLGGIHLPESKTINFDELAPELGLVPGNVYDFRLFFAERHVEQSNLSLTTTARFVTCSRE